jgi:hypothetical protein
MIANINDISRIIENMMNDGLLSIVIRPLQSKVSPSHKKPTPICIRISYPTVTVISTPTQGALLTG